MADIYSLVLVVSYTVVWYCFEKRHLWEKKMFFLSFLRFGKVISAIIDKDIIIGVSYILYTEHRERGKMLSVVSTVKNSLRAFFIAVLALMSTFTYNYKDFSYND